MDKVKRIDIRLHIDERGWVVWPIADVDLDQQRLHHFHLPSLKPGAIRGNHYHLRSIEFALILSGPCRAIFKDNETGEQQNVIVEGDTPVLFKISANVTHTFKNESSRDIFLLCYEQCSGDRNAPDIFKQTIL
jgi:dTDP-4-dehydrorhamnose 3,5-epimerase